MKTIIIYTTLALAILIISMDHAFAIDSDSTKAKKGFFELGKSKGLMMASSLGMHINPTNNSYHIIDPFYYQSPKSTVAVNMQHTIGYQFDERFIVGFGFGFENFDYLMVPTFLDLRFNLSKSDHTFFLVTKSGYSHPWDKEDEYRQYYGGYYHFSGIGYRSQFTEAMALEFSLGYKHQQAKMKEDYYDWWGPSSGTNTYNMQYNRVEMRIGLFIR